MTSTSPKQKILPLFILLSFFILILALVALFNSGYFKSFERASASSEDETLVLRVEAEKGALVLPFKKSDTYISQSVDTTDNSKKGGVAKYSVSVPQDGKYVIDIEVKAEKDSQNSILVDFDNDPLSDSRIWDINLTSGFQFRRVTARGSGTFDNNEFKPKMFDLKAGLHTLYIRGREANVQVDVIKIYLKASINTPKPSSPSSANLLPNGTFENNFLSGFGSKQSCCDYSAKIVNSPVRSGNNSLQVELRQSDPITAQSKRSEYYTSDAEFNQDYTYTTSIFIPNDWVIDTSKEIVAQWHNHPNEGEEFRNPALSLRINGKNWELRNNWDDRVITQVDQYQHDIYVDLGPFQKGAWTDWRVHAVWSYKGTGGILEVYKNEKLVYSRSGPNTFNDPKAPYFKFGIYKWDWKSGSTLTNKRVIYYDNVGVYKN